jgi:hypothetical protein
MRRYSQVLAVVAIVLFFWGVDLYLFLADYTTITPRDWVTLFGMLLSPLAIYHLYRQERVDAQLGRIALWALVYMAISVTWYSFEPSAVAMQELRDRLLAVCFLGLTSFVLTRQECRRAAGIAAVVVGLATVIINVLEMVEADWFYMQEPTRSSGLYGNANQCGAALVVGMIIGSQVVPRRLRLSFYLLVGAGVAVTFSRSTMTGWLIAAGVMLAFDSIKARARDIAVGCVAAVALLLVLFQGAASSGLLGGFILDNNQWERVSFFKTLETSDDAAQERKAVASKAWNMFLDRPLQGNGLASTVDWSERGSTHNMFLYFMADHGVVGAFILPALLICVLLGRPRGAQGSHWAFCMFTLWYAFFSHNIVGERYFLVGYAFFAMGGTIDVQVTRHLSARLLVRRPNAAAGSFPTPLEAN